ncbi:MAG: YdeI/OmpD-associated family protein [Saprospiraceae bacterium]|nr:YdeI/OmpD-associated family protein [Saprospiraceae bacterium]
MADDTPFVDGTYRLQKYPGKGGWTYAEIPEIKQDPARPFGWVTVRGSIDDYPLDHYKLMPMGQGRLFLPVKKEIRKRIGKEAGDEVHIVLYPEDRPVEIPDEIMACFDGEPAHMLKTFLEMTDGEKKAYIDWIYDAKSESTRIRRILQMMERLKLGLRLHDRLDDA